MEPWNSDDWQGRTEQQVKNNHKLMGLILTFMGIFVIILTSVYFFKHV